MNVLLPCQCNIFYLWCTGYVRLYFKNVLRSDELRKCISYATTLVGAPHINYNSTHAVLSVQELPYWYSLSDPPLSLIRNHAKACSYFPIQIGDFIILGACNSILDLGVLEFLFINRLKPVLNSAKTAVPLLIVNAQPLLNFFFYETVLVSQLLFLSFHLINNCTNFIFLLQFFIAEEEIFLETFINY